MRYLKRKVSLYQRDRPISQDQTSPPVKQDSYQKSDEEKISVPLQIPLPYQNTRPDVKKEVHIDHYEEVKKECPKTQSKTIVKNFGKAMCSFASSELGLPYLRQIVGKGENLIRSFQVYIKKKKRTVDSIESLRSLLLPSKDDSKEMVLFKDIFKEISIIFIKYFSVNWIFQGKMAHKQAHLRARFKMLRRVKNPEYFTYFKGFVKESEAKLS